MIRHKGAVVVMTALLAFGAANPAGATPVQKDLTVNLSIRSDLVIQALDCSNSGNHYVEISGSTSGLGPVYGQVTFRSPSNKQSEPAISNGILLDAGSATPLDKRGVGDGVGGNPWIYMTADDGSTVLLGRCVQGFKANWGHTKNVTIPVSTTSLATECSVWGSSVSTSANNKPSAAQGVTIYFDNKSPDNVSAPRPHKDARNVTFSLSATAGMGYDQKHRGIGGNPDVYLNVSGSQTMGDGTYLGRCKALQ